MQVPMSHEARRHRRRERRLKAVAVLPSLMTLGNLMCGFAAIYVCLLSADWQGADLGYTTFNNHRMERIFPTYLAIGAYLIFAAMFFDVLDGRLARLTRKTSDFGAQLDSLSDIVSFGVAPAILAMCIARVTYGGGTIEDSLARMWWRVEAGMLGVYVCCTAIRLARFNVENVADEAAHRYFKGLPSPGAAAALISLVILHEELHRTVGLTSWATKVVEGATPPMALLIGLLMVSRFRYPHLVNTVLRGRRPLSHIVMMLAVIFGVLGFGIGWPQITLAVLACAYVCVGPIWEILRVRSERRTAITAQSPEGAAAPTDDRNFGAAAESRRN